MTTFVDAKGLDFYACKAFQKQHPEGRTPPAPPPLNQRVVSEGFPGAPSVTGNGKAAGLTTGAGKSGGPTADDKVLRVRPYLVSPTHNAHAHPSFFRQRMHTFFTSSIP